MGSASCIENRKPKEDNTETKDKASAKADLQKRSNVNAEKMNKTSINTNPQERSSMNVEKMEVINNTE